LVSIATSKPAAPMERADEIAIDLEHRLAAGQHREAAVPAAIRALDGQD